MLRSLVARLCAAARPGRRVFVSELGERSAVVVRSLVFGSVVYYAYIEYPVFHQGKRRLHRYAANAGLPFMTRADADAWCAAAVRFLDFTSSAGIPVSKFPALSRGSSVPGGLSLS